MAKIAATLIGSLLALFATPLPAASAPESASPEAPFIDAKAIKERFPEITAADMEMLRGKRILMCGRSFALNLCGGLQTLARKDAKYEMLSSFRRFDLFKGGGNLNLIPPDIFGQVKIVHFLATNSPPTRRLDELERLLREPPHRFGEKIDAAIIVFSTAMPAYFERYAVKMDALRAEFPKLRLIYATAGLMGPKRQKENEQAHRFSELVRERYRGKVPIYDLGAILSDDFRVGHVFVPEYSTDPAGIHPNTGAGETAMARGFLLVLRDAFRQPAATTPAAKPAAPAPEVKVESLPADSPDAKAVRAILDANHLRDKTVEGVVEVQGGRVVGLFLQEGGIVEIPDAIGQLTALRTLHCYGDRELPHPLLRKISPAIGRCAKLEILLLNNNELTTLPVEIARLTNLKDLSLADNRLANLLPAVLAWARNLDPEGLACQCPP